MLGDGSRWGVEYAVQPSPDGLAQAFRSEPTSWRVPRALGDNLFHGHDLVPVVNSNAQAEGDGFAYPVSDPERYGVAEFDSDGRALSLEENSSPKAVTQSLRNFYDDVERARQVKPSARGNWKFRSHQMYLDEGMLRVELMDVACLARHRHLRFPQRCRQLHPHVGAPPGPEGGMPGRGGLASGLDHSRTTNQLAQPLKKSGYGSYLLQMLEESVSDHAALQTSLDVEVSHAV